jgi:hypothetical protein
MNRIIRDVSVAQGTSFEGRDLRLWESGKVAATETGISIVVLAFGQFGNEVNGTAPAGAVLERGVALSPRSQEVPLPM